MSSDTPEDRSAKIARIREIVGVITTPVPGGDWRDRIAREMTMRIPAETNRDADLVLSWAADEIERLHDALHRNERLNIERTGTGVRVCRGDHHRSSDCEWEEYVPYSLLAERDAEIEKLRVRAQELRDLAYSYEQRSIAYECDREILIDGLASANGEIERLQKDLRDALDAESTNARNAAHYCSLLSDATDNLATERQRARLPEDLLDRAKTLRDNPPSDPYDAMNAGFRLARDILAAVEQTP